METIWGLRGLIMAATGFTPVFIYSSSTGGNAPAAANLTNTTLGSELAINITDGYLFYKDNANAIQKIGIKNPATTSGTLAQFASTTSSQLAGVISDETGSGSLVFATSPTLTTPNIGAATGTSLVTGNITYNTTGATSTGRLTLTPASGDYVFIDGGTDDAFKQRIANEEVAFIAGPFGTGSTYAREFVLTSARLDSGDLPYLRIGGQGGIKFAVDVNTVRATIFPSGGVSIGNTTDPGATNLSVTGSVRINTSAPVDSEMLSVVQSSVKQAAFFNVNAASSTAYPGVSIRKYDNNNTTSQTYMAFAYNQGTSGAGGIQGNGASGCQFFSSSDVRLKENIVELESQLDKILALKPKKYDFIDGPKDCTGFIAQDFEQIYPDNVNVGSDGYLTIGGVSVTETRIIKALQEIVEKLKAAGVAGF